MTSGAVKLTARRKELRHLPQSALGFRTPESGLLFNNIEGADVWYNYCSF